MPGHLGLIDRNAKQAGTLLGRQQGATGHDGLLLMAVHKAIAFEGHFEEDIESRNARSCRGPCFHSQTAVCESRQRHAARLCSGLQGDEQSNEAQAKALSAAGCRRIFGEAASGGRWVRPELHRMLDQLREGDVVVVWKLDRLSRSLKDVLHIMERIGDAGAGFRSITEAIDTTTPAGRMMMQMVGAFAEFERAMIRERTSAGLAAARAEGRIGGRRKNSIPPSAAKSPKASSPAARPAPIWRDFTTSARRPCHASSPRTAPASPSSGRVAVPIDTDKIDETVLALLHLTLHDRARAWKVTTGRR